MYRIICKVTQEAEGTRLESVQTGDRAGVQIPHFAPLKEQ